MEADFWHARWQRGEIGFHKQSTNPLLTRWWPSLGLAADEPVWVPLCGKSLDMLWLREQGHPVIGVELARSALDAFAQEQELDLHWSQQDGFACLAGQGFHLLCGDFFALCPAHLHGVRAVYDRAALIALPVDMRERYVAHLRTVLGRDWRMLLVTLDYPQEQRPGPPFSVPDDEVRLLFTGCRIDVLEDTDVLAEHPVFREQGMTRLRERVYAIQAPTV